VINHKTAIFRQINKDRAAAHHVALEFPDGQIVLLTLLCEGQLATVLQLPAEPKAATETELAFERRKIETEAKLKPARLARTRLLFSISGHAGATNINALFVGFKTKRNLRLTQCPA